MFELILEKLGFNPADLKKQVDDAAMNFNRCVDHFNRRFDIIEKQNQIIIKLLSGGENEKSTLIALEKLSDQPLQTEIYPNGKAS